MDSNLDRYKKDLETLAREGDVLMEAMLSAVAPAGYRKLLQVRFKGQTKQIQKALDDLPNFIFSYQPWYSEAKTVIKQLLPDRLDDFVRHYEKPKSRKAISYENYRIDDYLQSLTVTRGGQFAPKEMIVGPDAAIPHFQQQLSILKSVRARFESSLFYIRQLVMADLFDSELEAAEELAKKKFTRAAGAVAGVVLEKHLAQVCENHKGAISKKNPGISDLNDVLKGAGVIDLPTWRFIQHLGDLRNLCDHNKKAEPTITQVDDLLSGVKKVVKTLF
jgi:hypothetical protein